MTKSYKSQIQTKLDVYTIDCLPISKRIYFISLFEWIMTQTNKNSVIPSKHYSQFLLLLYDDTTSLPAPCVPTVNSSIFCSNSMRYN